MGRGGTVDANRLCNLELNAPGTGLPRSWDVLKSCMLSKIGGHEYGI